MRKIKSLIFDSSKWTFADVVKAVEEHGFPKGAQVEWSSDAHDKIRVPCPGEVSDEFVEELKDGVEIVFDEELQIDDPGGEVDSLLAARMVVVPIRQAGGEILLVPVIRKTYGCEITKDTGDANNGKLRLTSTTDEVDRYGDVIPIGTWDFKNYMRNPVMLFNHDYGVVAGHPPVQAKTLRIVERKHKIEQVVQFHRKTPFNEELYSLYRDGFMSAVSVGFGTTSKPLLRTSDDGEILGVEFTGQDLFETSFVAVGANPSALSYSALGLPDLSDALNSAVQKGLIRGTTRDYLLSLSPNARGSLEGAAGKSPDNAAGGQQEEEDLTRALAHSFETRATLDSLERVRRIK